jgi:hypothetical protein
MKDGIRGKYNKQYLVKPNLVLLDKGMAKVNSITIRKNGKQTTA